MISVIFPTRNRADLLAAALESLTRQSLSAERFEVLVVDNGSADDTAGVARAFADRLPALRYFFAPEPGLHVGRHCGMRHARGEILVFADDDIEAQPSWLAAIEEAFCRREVALVGGNNLPLFLSPPPAWLERLWNRPLKEGGRALTALSLLELEGGPRPLSPFLVWGCNFSIRKSVLLQAGGFHPDGMPRDLLGFRGDGETHVSRHVHQTGAECVFHPGASVFHKVTPERMTFEYFHQRGFSQGISDSYSTLRAGQNDASGNGPGLLRRIGGSIRRWMQSLSPGDADVRRALDALKRGHAEGYAYHQRLYAEDAAVKAWVHQARYFNEDLTP